MSKWKIFILAVASATVMASCDRFEGGVEVPSYLRIGAIKLVDNPSDSWSMEDGFFTYNIDGVNITIWQEGDTAETVLGTFSLPCTVPVLKNGNIDRVEILPVVKQNGIAGTRIYYPYYEPIHLTNVRLAADSLTDLDTLVTRYVPKSRMKVLWEEYFEPGPGEVSLDSVVSRLVYKPDTVQSGYGCGVVRVPDTITSINFWTDRMFTLDDPSAVLYLEMDYWSDFNFSVGMKNPTYDDGVDVSVTAMTVFGKPEAGWKKIYINMGKIWAEDYRYYHKIRLFFTVLNGNGKEGNLFIDNMKLIATWM